MSKSTAAEVLREAADVKPKRPAAIVDAGAADAKPATNDNARQKKAVAAKVKDRYHRFTVDVWITNLNSIEFGFYKHARNKAKSRQFTSDMDIFAEIIEDGERTGLLGYRADLWTTKTGFDKRLVFKLFGEKLNWHATMDLMLGRSVQQTVGARGLPVVSYSVNTGDHDQIVYVERSANKWPMLAEHFSFFLMEDGHLKFYRIKQDLISFGQDYSVYDGVGNRIGLLDGKLISLGGLWKCKVLAEHADKRLLAVLKMFVGMLSFNKPCRRHVKQLARGVAAGKASPKIEKQEADLYLNPRRVR